MPADAAEAQRKFWCLPQTVKAHCHLWAATSISRQREPAESPSRERVSAAGPPSAAGGEPPVCKCRWAAVPDRQITACKPSHRELLPGFLGSGLCWSPGGRIVLRLGKSSDPWSLLVDEAFVTALAILSPLTPHKGSPRLSLLSAWRLFSRDLEKPGDTGDFIFSGRRD